MPRQKAGSQGSYMQEQSDDPLRESAQKVVLRQVTLSERWVRVVRTGLQLVPFGIGSAIEAGYFGTIDDRRVARLETFFKQLAEDVDRLSDSRTELPSADTMVDAFASDEFGYMFEGVLKRVNAEVAAHKLDALRGVLVSIILDDTKVPFEKQSSFLNTLDAIDRTHIRVLQLLSVRPCEEEFLSRNTLCKALDAKSEADVGYVYFVLDTLANREFIMSGPIPFDQDGSLDRPRQTFRITGFGMEFLEFVRQRGPTGRA